MTKTELIHSMPASMTASEIVAEAKKRGVKLSSQLVYLVRGSKLKKGKAGRPKKSAANARRPRKVPAASKRRRLAAKSTSLTDAEKQLATLILTHGLEPVEELLERLQKALG